MSIWQRRAKCSPFPLSKTPTSIFRCCFELKSRRFESKQKFFDVFVTLIDRPENVEVDPLALVFAHILWKTVLIGAFHIFIRLGCCERRVSTVFDSASGRFTTSTLPFRLVLFVILEMSTPQTKQSSAPAADNEVELQSQPMDLAHKSNPVLTGSATALPTRVIGETAKPIFLVRSS